VESTPRAGTTGLVIPAPAGNATHDQCRAGPAAVRRQEERPFAAFAGRQVDRRVVRSASGIVTTLPPLRVTTSVRYPRSTPRGPVTVALRRG
jgi:hypothetical protein